jgi:hypothetical protein
MIFKTDQVLETPGASNPKAYWSTSTESEETLSVSPAHQFDEKKALHLDKRPIH